MDLVDLISIWLQRIQKFQVPKAILLAATI